MSVQNSNVDPLIEGLIAAYFRDIGPTIIFNSTELQLNDEDLVALAMGSLGTIHQMKSKEIYGPFPVPKFTELRALTFMFVVLGYGMYRRDWSDEAPKDIGVWIIYHKEKEKRIQAAMGMIKIYISLFTSMLKSEKDLTREVMQQIDHDFRKIKAKIDLNHPLVSLVGQFDPYTLQNLSDDLCPFCGSFNIKMALEKSSKRKWYFCIRCGNIIQ
ncbi:MAG: hypothetical protein ACFFC7_34555 [Candidatus Hermodarchaeota archaeon]